MNSIDPKASGSAAERLAAELFDEGLAPLAAARRRRGAPDWLPVGRERQATSYFSPVARGSNAPCDLALPGGGTAAGLVEATLAYWRSSGDAELCALGPGLQRIAAALEDEAVEADGAVSVFCYAMF